MGIPEEKKEKIKQKIFETIMTRNFPKLMSDTKSQIQELKVHQKRKCQETDNKTNKKYICHTYHSPTSENKKY